jgi:hypothetical protein
MIVLGSLWRNTQFEIGNAPYEESKNGRDKKVLRQNHGYLPEAA